MARGELVGQAGAAHGLACACVLFLVALSPAAASAQAPAPPLEWVWRGGSGGFDLGEGLALDREGNTFLAGISQVDGDQDIVLVKLDAQGALAWSRRVHVGPRDRGEDVAADAAGNAYVVATVNTLAGDDVLLLKYGPSGEQLWTATFDRGTSEAARSIVVAPGGDLVVSGVSLSANGADGFVARFSPAGELRWARPINLYAVEELFDVAVDAEGSAVVAGRALRDGDFDVFARKYDAAGALVWTQTLPRPGRDEARGIALDARGHAHLVGTTEASATGTDLLLVELDTGGAVVSTRTLDLAGGADEGRDLVIDAAGNLHVTGFLERDGDKDPFVLKLDPEGRTLWNATWHGDGLDGTGTLAITPDGARVVTGGASQVEGGVFDLLVLSYAPGRPEAGFAVATSAPEAKLAVRFEERSAPGQAPLSSWRWSFGDGGSSNAQNPEHVYAFGGDYTVELLVADGWGAVHAASRVVHVAGPTRAEAETESAPAPGLAAETPAAQARAAPLLSAGAPLALLVGALLASRRRRR